MLCACGGIAITWSDPTRDPLLSPHGSPTAFLIIPGTGLAVTRDSYVRRSPLQHFCSPVVRASRISLLLVTESVGLALWSSRIA